MNKEELNIKLLQAAENSDLNEIKSLINQGADINYKDSKNNFTSLLHASLTNKLNLVKFLVELGADIEAKTDLNNTSLFLACKRGYLDIVKFLVKSGAKLEYKLKYNNKSALEEAANSNRLNIINYIENQAFIDSILGFNYDYTKSRKLQLIDTIKKDISIYNKLNDNDKELIKNDPLIKSLSKSEEYGLFENIMNFSQWKIKK